MKAKSIQTTQFPMRGDPTYVSPKNEAAAGDLAEPVANPAPTIDGKKPIPAGEHAVEEFMVTNDTGGGD